MNKMYIPNTSHWMDYYENLGNNGSNTYINQLNKSGKQIGGGSLVGTPKSFITPIGPSMKDSTNEKLKVQLVSPVQQTEDMVKREKVKMGIKRKSQTSPNSSTKRALKSKSQKKSRKSKIRNSKKGKGKGKGKKNIKKKKSKTPLKTGKKSKILKSVKRFKDIFD